MTAVASKKSTQELRLERLREPTFADDLIIACLWPKQDNNLGTTLRTCDAVGATMVVPRTPISRKAINRGNTIGLHNSPVELIDDEWFWLSRMAQTRRIVGVELAYHSIPLSELEPATEPTVVVVGHEVNGIPDAALNLCDEVVEIPMQGVGNSLNVAVSAALVLYKLKGWT